MALAWFFLLVMAGRDVEFTHHNEDVNVFLCFDVTGGCSSTVSDPQRTVHTNYSDIMRANGGIDPETLINSY